MLENCFTGDGFCSQSELIADDGEPGLNAEKGILSEDGLSTFFSSSEGF